MDAIERARDYAQNPAARPIANEDLEPARENVMDDSLEAESASPPPTSTTRGILYKVNADSDSTKGRKRFSKRQSKSGLQAVF